MTFLYLILPETARQALFALPAVADVDDFARVNSKETVILETEQGRSDEIQAVRVSMDLHLSTAVGAELVGGFNGLAAGGTELAR